MSQSCKPCDKPIDSITLRGEWKHSIRPGTRKGYPVFTLLVNVVLYVLVTDVWKGNETEEITGKEEGMAPLFVKDIVLCLKVFTRKYLGVIYPEYFLQLKGNITESDQEKNFHLQ